MAQPVTSRQSIFSFIKESLQSEGQDYTQGSLRRAVFLLAIPMIAEMMMESVFAVVDLYFVGHLEDSSYAVQTVGLTESVLTLIYSLAIGISMAATAIVARRTGEKDADGAARSGAQSIVLGVGVALVLSLVGMWFAPDVLRLMGAEAKTVTMGTPYVRIMMGSTTAIMLLFLINGIFRGVGDAAMAMRSLWLANVCNIVLCPLFIRGLGPIPALGLTGAAVATTIGRSAGVVYQLYYLLRGSAQLHMKAVHFKPYAQQIRAIVRIAAPGTLQFVIASCSWIFLARMVAQSGGDEASAGYQTGIRIILFFLLPAWGLSNAAATLVGQNLGAGLPGRAEASVMATARYNTIFMGIVTLVIQLLAPFIVGVFTTNAAVQQYAVQTMRIISAGYIFYGIGMVMANAFNGAGDTWTPTWINLGGFWAFQIPLAYVLAIVWSWGPIGVFIAVPVAETGIALAAYVLFKRGKWKEKKV